MKFSIYLNRRCFRNACKQWIYTHTHTHNNKTAEMSKYFWARLSSFGQLGLISDAPIQFLNSQNGLSDQKDKLHWSEVRWHVQRPPKGTNHICTESKISLKEWDLRVVNTYTRQDTRIEIAIVSSFSFCGEDGAGAERGGGQTSSIRPLRLYQWP